VILWLDARHMRATVRPTASVGESGRLSSPEVCVRVPIGHEIHEAHRNTPDRSALAIAGESRKARTPFIPLTPYIHFLPTPSIAPFSSLNAINSTLRTSTPARDSGIISTYLAGFPEMPLETAPSNSSELHSVGQLLRQRG